MGMKRTISINTKDDIYLLLNVKRKDLFLLIWGQNNNKWAKFVPN